MERALTWGVAIGVAFGAVLGIAADNLPLGVAIGIALGAGGGGVWQMLNDRRKGGS